MKKFTLYLSTLLLLVSHINAKEFKLATIDMQRVIREYKDLQNAKREMLDYEREWKKVKDSLYSELQQKNKEFEKKLPMLTVKGILDEQKKIKELEEKYNEYIKKIWGEGGEYNKKLKEITRPYLDKLHETINKIAEEDEYDIIVDKSAKFIIYARNTLDITNDVINYLNKEFVSDFQIERKKIIAVFPLLEKDKDVKTMGLGMRSQEIVIASLRNSPNFDILPQGSVNNRMSSMGIRPENINETQAAQVASVLNADYFVIGEVSKQSLGIKFVLHLYDTRTMQDVNRIESMAENAEELLEQKLANKARELITPIISNN